MGSPRDLPYSSAMAWASSAVCLPSAWAFCKAFMESLPGSRLWASLPSLSVLNSSPPAAQADLFLAFLWGTSDNLSVSGLALCLCQKKENWGGGWTDGYPGHNYQWLFPSMSALASGITSRQPPSHCSPEPSVQNELCAYRYSIKLAYLTEFHTGHLHEIKEYWHCDLYILNT